MIILVNASKNRPGYDPSCLGDFITPHRWRQTGTTEVWAADNGAFAGFEEDRFVKMCESILRGIKAGMCPIPKFITLPDVVADHDATRHLWYHWHQMLGWARLPRAFVLQDGAEKYGIRPHMKGIPWDYFECLFIGGSTEFKLGEFTRRAIAEARRRDHWVHMGRVNSKRRMNYARCIGVQSIDGSGIARFGNTESMVQEVRQMHLWEN